MLGVIRPCTLCCSCVMACGHSSPLPTCADMTVSMLSAMRSLLCSEKLMPSVPMEMPSDTPMVLKR